MKVCTNCGFRNNAEALFCAGCNFFLEWSDQAAPGARPTPLAAAPPTAGRVVISTEPLRPAAQTERVPQIETLPTGPSSVEVQSTEQHLFEAAVDGLERGKELVVARDRWDLAKALDKTKERLAERTVGVAVIGEFKQGKSTLINALLQTAVCPVDADEVTVVPTLVRYGETPSATAYREPGIIPGQAGSSPGDTRAESVPVDQIAAYVSEVGNPKNWRRLRSVEVRLPRKMLRTGMCLIDTPGVGGLDSANGIITLGALDQAVGTLFVTDASQELTQPELEFLRQALDRCPVAACVMTKTDLYPKWRHIVALNEDHLSRAGLDVPVIPVSSFLRLAARRDPGLTNESGYPALVDFLATEVVRKANDSAAAAAAYEVGFVTDQLVAQNTAEKAVLAQPAQAERVLAQLATAHGRTAQLASPTASWQQMLGDGVQDLVADVEHDLQGRFRTVLHDVEAIIDACDPADTWDDIEAWLRRHVIAAALANYDTLAERTRKLAADVGETFNLTAGGAIALQTGSPPESHTLINLASAKSLATPGGRFGPMLMATRSALFVPMVLFGVAGSLLGVAVAAPLTALLAAGIGQKVIRDERKRQIAYRRQQAKVAARRYVEEVSFHVNKESRDALRRTQRLLRDDFHTRAQTLHRSSGTAMQAARRAMTLTGPSRTQRVSQLATEAAQLRQVNGRVAQLIAAVPASGVA